MIANCILYMWYKPLKTSVLHRQRAFYYMGPNAVLGRCILRCCHVGERRDGYGPGSPGDDRQVWMRLRKSLGKFTLFAVSSVVSHPRADLSWSLPQVPVTGRAWPEAPRGWWRSFAGHAFAQPDLLYAADEGSVDFAHVLVPSCCWRARLRPIMWILGQSGSRQNISLGLFSDWKSQASRSSHVCFVYLKLAGCCAKKDCKGDWWFQPICLLWVLSGVPLLNSFRIPVELRTE